MCGGLRGKPRQMFEGTTSANELAYELHRANVATRELACAVDWEACQGRCSKVLKIFHIHKKKSQKRVFFCDLLWKA